MAMSVQTEVGKVDLTNCDREPIQVPGAIQPHGALLAFREPDLTVTQVSANVGEHLGTSVEHTLGAPLSALISPRSVAAVQSALDVGSWEEVNPLRIDAGGRSFDGILHRHDGVAILELEPADTSSGRADVHHPLRRALIGMRSARTLPDLCESAAREVRRATGFDRVMVYRFDEDGHGSVDAEDKDEALEPYLGLHYPASDIPRQARELYLKNWLRIIPDARYAPASLVPLFRPDNGAPLDLSFAVLRSVSPIHLEYLRNMGVHAAMSVSLVVRDRLWGLLSCVHHRGPWLVPYEIRLGCEVLGRLMSLQIAAFEDRQVGMEREARRGTQDALAAAMSGGDGDVLASLLARPVDLLALVNASGAAIEINGEISCAGRAPPSSFVSALARWVDEPAGLAPWSMASLPSAFESAAAVADVASGTMTFALPGNPRRRLFWFRPEIVETVSWGGDPRKPVQVDPAMRIHPRRSFAAWKEEVRLRSLPWTTSDREAAAELRRTAMEIDLERQVRREQQAVRARDDLMAVVSHDLRNPLNVIQAQAALLLPNSGASDEHAAAIDRIQRSVDQMTALIHDLLDLAKIEAGRFVLRRAAENVGEIVDETLSSLRPLAQAKRIAMTGDAIDLTVFADRERIIQVLSNLVGNAIKFTPEGGAIRVRAERRGEQVLFTVSDNGPGIAPDDIPRLFDRYSQGKRKASAEGAGLGLYIVRGIVEAHGGRVWAEVPPEGGATLKFELPLRGRRAGVP
jgi:two-component system, chemotaxis family, sensor kinase Cph1